MKNWSRNYEQNQKDTLDDPETSGTDCNGSLFGDDAEDLMSTKTEFKVEGLDKIERMMKRLPDRNQKKIRRGALRAGARVVVLAIREEIGMIPDSQLSTSGKDRYKRSIGVETQKSKRYEGGVFVGARYKGVKHIFPEAHLFEHGTKQRVTTSGASRGRIRPNPANRRGWEKARKQAVDDTRRELVDRTIDEADKLLN